MRANRDIKFLRKAVWSTVINACKFITDLDVTRKWTRDYWTSTAKMVTRMSHKLRVSVHYQFCLFGVKFFLKALDISVLLHLHDIPTNKNLSECKGTRTVDSPPILFWKWFFLSRGKNVKNVTLLVLLTDLKPIHTADMN